MAFFAKPATRLSRFYHATHFSIDQPQFDLNPKRLKTPENKWRKRVGVEPTGDTARCRPPVLKTGTITGPHALPFLLSTSHLQILPQISARLREDTMERCPTG